MKVTIFQYRMFHYRERLFELMRDKAAAAGIELRVVYGQAYRHELKKRDSVDLAWGHKVRSMYFPIKEKKDLCWQPAPATVRDSDLFVFMHENRLLANYWWLLRRRLGLGPKVAFWGHGRDFQSNAPGGLREKWKRLTLRWPDWWFGYTCLTRAILLDARYPDERITVVNNAIDNEQFSRDLQQVSGAEIAALRDETGFAADDFVAVYCGSLYAEKRLDQLFDIAVRTHAIEPRFRLLILGDGALRGEVESFAASRPWVRYLGAVHRLRKATCFRMAQLLLGPGAVGLNILDAFIAGTPLVTMRSAKHGPEIGFLDDGVNGWLIDDDVDDYVACLVALMADPAALAAAQQAALRAAEEYTVERMAERFVAGMRAALRPENTEVPA